MTEEYPMLFSPLTLAGQKIKNRIAMAPLTRQMAEPDGTPTDEMVAYYARRARGGFGLIITEGTYETDDRHGCKAYLSQPGIANSKHVSAWKKVAEAIHANGGKAILQLMHGGRVADPRVLPKGAVSGSASAGQSQGWVLYTDSDEEKHLRGISGDWPKVTFDSCRELSVAEIHAIADGFADGAKRAMDAGFDGVEVHGANGYLLWQFMNPKTNRRSDDFGGSPENNVRFAKLACAKIREAIGKDKIITLRLSQDGVDDFAGAWPGGVGYAQSIGTALKDCAANALHWSSFGWRDNRDPGSRTPMSEVIRRASGLPMITNGGIAEGAEAEACLTSGGGDMVAIGRTSFTHPDWPYIVRSGHAYDWLPFDRKYVVRPPTDYGLAYSVALEDPKWPTTWQAGE